MMDIFSADFETQYSALVRKFGTPMDGAPKTYEYVVEECAELIQAIQHYKRGRDNARAKVVNEMADVYTLLDALCWYLMIDVSEINFYKGRLIKRYIDQPNDGRHIE